jgi:protein phosphatase 1 regulatory subunit 7
MASEAEPTANGVGHANGNETSPSPKPGTPTSRSGWDGKLRVNKQATLANPEALSDPDYSDEDAPPVDQIDADEDLLEGESADVEVNSLPRRHGVTSLIAAALGDRCTTLARIVHVIVTSRTIHEPPATLPSPKPDPTN